MKYSNLFLKTHDGKLSFQEKGIACYRNRNVYQLEIY